MALATRCPSCHALFRVVADQLKLRGGLVRCGGCGHVFDAIGTLSYLDDASVRPAATSAPATIEPTPTPAPVVPPAEFAGQPATVPVEGPSVPDRRDETIVAATVPDESNAEFAIDRRQDESHVEGRPIVRAADETHDTEKIEAIDSEEPPADRSAEVDRAASELVDEAVVPDTSAPAFLHEGSTPRRRVVTLVYALGAALAALALALQLVVMYRTEIAAQLPATRPVLVAVCQVMHCAVGWPMHGELLAIVGSELQSLPGTNALELTAVVRNRAEITLALPALEVTLTDTQNRAVARRIFGPIDYLGPSEAAARLADGLQAGADMIVRINFEARGLNVAGFVVYPFYL